MMKRLAKITVLLGLLGSLAACTNDMGLGDVELSTKVYSKKKKTKKVKKVKKVKKAKKGNQKGDQKLKLIKKYTGFSSPTAMAIDKENNLYVSNWGGDSVTKISSNGEKSKFVTGMSSPAGLAFDKSGNLYVSDYSADVILKVDKNGKKTTFANNLSTPTGISFDKAGNLLVTNRGSDEIVSIDPQGKKTIISNKMQTPVGVVEDSQGNLFITNYGGSVLKIDTNKQVSVFSKGFARPGVGIDITAKGEIIAADNGGDCVRRIAKDGSTEVIADKIGGCVGVRAHNDQLYVSSWSDGAVYVYSLN